MTDAALALIRLGDRWFLQRRAPANPVLPGLWEFPGGKVERDESFEAALVRELQEEVGLRMKSAQPWSLVEGPVRLHPFLVVVTGDPSTDLAWGWFTVEEMRRLPIPPLNAALIDRLAEIAVSGTHPSDLVG